MAEEETDFSLAISTCGFNMIRDKMPIFPDVLELYPGLLDTLKNVMFVSPTAWDSSPETQDIQGRKVTFLQLLQISGGEMMYAKSNGSEALEDLLEKKNIDIYDIDRESVI